MPLRSEFPDQAINTRELCLAIEAAGLPVRKVSRLSRRPNDDGGLQSVPPYIVILTDDLNVAQQEALAALVRAHIPTPEPTSIEEEWAAATNQGQKIRVLSRLAGLE